MSNLEEFIDNLKFVSAVLHNESPTIYGDGSITRDISGSRLEATYAQTAKEIFSSVWGMFRRLKQCWDMNPMQI